MKKAKKSKNGYLYRVRKSGVEEYCNVPYNKVEDISSCGPVIGEFLSKNFIFTMYKCMHFSHETWDKNMVILGSKDAVLEIEKPIYDRYKEEIDNAITNNMNWAVNEYLNEGKTRIVVRFDLGGCAYDFEEEHTDLGDVNRICGLNTLFISYANPNDIILFKNIIISFIGDDKPSYKFLNSDDILLQAWERSLVLDKSAYNLMTDVIKEHEYNLMKNGASKVMQMKLEDKNE